MRVLATYLLLCFFTIASFGQETAFQLGLSEAFDREIRSSLSLKVDTISVSSLANSYSDYIILDAREKEEFDVSHIPNAIHIGYKKLDTDLLANIDKSMPVVVYCSIGYRSEKVTQKMLKMGFENVQNLYGSIFLWVNHGYGVVDKNGKPTKSVHTYNKKWSRWVENNNIEKVW